MAKVTFHDGATRSIKSELHMEQMDLAQRKKRLLAIIGLVEKADLWGPIEAAAAIIILVHSMKMDKEQDTMDELHRRVSQMEESGDESEYKDHLNNSLGLLENLTAGVSGLSAAMMQTAQVLQAKEDFNQLFSLIEEAVTTPSDDPEELARLEQQIQSQMEVCQQFDNQGKLGEFKDAYEKENGEWKTEDIKESLERLSSTMGDLGVDANWIGPALETLEDVDRLRSRSFE